MSASTWNFYTIDEGCAVFPAVRETFSRLIAPLYGNQSKALTAIGVGTDRLCEVLFVGEKPKGLLVYKKALNEGVLELKTLCLFHPEEESGRGYGSLLHKRLLDVARIRGATKIAVSVSSSKPESLLFFEKKGFSLVRMVPGQYRVGVTEYFLECALPTQVPSSALIFALNRAEDPKYARANSAPYSYRF